MSTETIARTLVARVEVISHGTTQAFDPMPHGSEQEPGGVRPRGGVDYEDDKEPDFALRSHEHYRRRLAGCRIDEDYRAVANDAMNTLKAWRRTPPPPTDSIPWQEQVGKASGTIRAVAATWGISPTRVYQLRQQYA